jgi:hypothetical protein
MACSVRLALVLSLLVLAPALVGQPTPRRPRGIYAVVNVQEQAAAEMNANPSITATESGAGRWRSCIMSGKGTDN